MCIAWLIGSVRMVVFCKFVSLTFGCRIQGKSTPNPGPWERYLSIHILVHDLFHSEWILVHKPHLYSIHIHIINHYIHIYIYIIELQHISKQSHTQVRQLHGLLSVLPQPFKLLPFFGKISPIQPCPHHKGPTLFTMSKGFAYILQIHAQRCNRSLNHRTSVMGTCLQLTHHIYFVYYYFTSQKHENIHPRVMSCRIHSGLPNISKIGGFIQHKAKGNDLRPHVFTIMKHVPEKPLSHLSKVQGDLPS